MRELVVENQKILLIPSKLNSVNKGTVTAVTASDFTLELDYEPENILKDTYCEFFTQTPHGKLFFQSYAKSIEGKTLVIASPAKHKFLQRRQFTRVKFIHDIDLKLNDQSYSIKTLDISGGGLKFQTSDKNGLYNVSIPISTKSYVNCKFEPIRIEKRFETEDFLISGQFIFDSNKDRMTITQFCAKRSVEIKNK